MRTLFLSIFTFFYWINLSASNIAVVTVAIGDEYQRIVSPSIENKREYCKKHGYDFFCLEHSLDPSRHPAWSKIKIIEEVLSTGIYEWIFWSDADALFMNFAVKLEELIDDKYDFILNRDENDLNSGHFYLKNTDWSRNFLVEVYNQTQFIYIYGGNNSYYRLLKDQQRMKKTKVIPSRLMNSYPINYKDGDFIIHFASTRGWRIFELLQEYASRVVDSKEMWSLDDYLKIYNFNLKPLHSSVNEGYMTEAQKGQFHNILNGYKNINTILEVGFNAGHSAEIFLSHFPNASLTSVDINHHSYTPIGVEFFRRKFGAQYQFHEGDSKVVLPNLANMNPSRKYDFIYIDGDHSFQGCYTDIINCQKLATKDTILWVDDYWFEVGAAVNRCVDLGIIEILNIFQSHDQDGSRCWVEARYL